MDGGEARIIMSALGTPASVMDNTPIPGLVDSAPSRRPVHTSSSAVDSHRGVAIIILHTSPFPDPFSKPDTPAVPAEGEPHDG